MSEGFPRIVFVVAERAADIPGAGSFPDQPDKVEVMVVTHFVSTHGKPPLFVFWPLKKGTLFSPFFAKQRQNVLALSLFKKVD
jgi:hypothetical protein